MKPRVRYLGRHLMVKGNYVDLILKGLKKATIRIGIIKPRYNEVIVHGGGRPVAKIYIKNVRYKKIRELNDADARLDGFRNKQELLENLKHMYGKISDDDIVTIIEYELIQSLNNLSVEDPYLGLSPADIARIALRYLSDQLSNKEKEILLDLTRTNSIRKTSLNLFKTLNKRYVVRKVLRKAAEMLKDKRILGIPCDMDC